MSFQKMYNFQSQVLRDSLDLGNLLRRRLPQAGQGAKLLEEALLTSPAHSGAVIENTFLDPALHK